MMFSQTMGLAGKLRNTPFIRNVLVVMTGSAIGQAIGFAATPLISRLFSPADFGVFGVFGAVTSVIASVATLDYSQAVMLPKRREDAGQVFLLSCLATMSVTALCAAVFMAVGLLFPAWLTGMLKGQGAWILALVVLAVFSRGLIASFQAWCVRVKAFNHTSVSQIVRGVSSNGLQIAFGLARFGAPGLVVASVLAEFLAGLNLLRRMRGDLLDFLAAVRVKRLKELALEYKDFPAFSATQNLLNAVSSDLPVLLLTHYFGIAVAGAYAFGMRLLSAPMSLILGALRQVLFQKAGEMQHQGRKLLPLFVKSTLGLFALALAPSAVLAIWAPQIFSWAFGEQWRVAGLFGRYMILWLLFVFSNLPAVLFARLIRIQHHLFVYDLIVLAARVLALVAGGLYLTAIQSVALFSVVGAVLNLILILFVGYALWRREGEGKLNLAPA